MPRYRVKDSQTGTSLLLEGDSPPTEDELVQIFSERAKSKPAPRETIDPRTILEPGVRSATELTDVVMRSISSPAAGEAAKAGRDQLQSEREQVLTTAIDVTGSVLKTLQNPAAGEASQMGRDAAQAERNDRDELHVGEEVRGLARSLERGGRRFVQMGDVLGLSRPAHYENLLTQAETELSQFDKDFPNVSAKTNPPGWRWKQDQISKISGLKHELERVKEMAPKLAVSLAGQQAEINKLPLTKAAAEFQKPENPWWTFFKNPIELSTQATAESLPIMALAMAGAPAGPAGVAMAAGAGSQTAESAARVTNAMQNDGVDLSSGESVLAWFNDKAKSDPAIAKANLAALGPASFDALTGGIAGRWLRRVVGKGLKPVAIATGKEIGVQMAGGGLGSIVASALAGEPVDWKDVVLEVAGEIAPGEAIANVQAERAYARIAQTAPLTAQALRETEQVKPAEPIPAAPPVETGTVAELQANLDKAKVEKAPESPAQPAEPTPSLESKEAPPAREPIIAGEAEGLDSKGRTPERQKLLDDMAAKVREETGARGMLAKSATPAEEVKAEPEAEVKTEPTKPDFIADNTHPVGSQAWRISNTIPEDWKVTPMDDGGWVAESPVTDKNGKQFKLVKTADAKGNGRMMGVNVEEVKAVLPPTKYQQDKAKKAEREAKDKFFIGLGYEKVSIGGGYGKYVGEGADTELNALTPEEVDAMWSAENNKPIVPKRGEVGGMMSSGEVVLTSSGRKTTPFPTIKTGPRSTGTTAKQVEAWLRDNALAEAESRGDEFNARMFRAEKVGNIPPASKDSMEEYLFGQQPAVPRPLLKPVTAKPEPASITALRKEIKQLRQGLPVAEDMAMNDKGRSLDILEAKITAVQDKITALLKVEHGEQEVDKTTKTPESKPSDEKRTEAPTRQPVENPPRMDVRKPPAESDGNVPEGGTGPVPGPEVSGGAEGSGEAETAGDSGEPGVRSGAERGAGAGGRPGIERPAAGTDAGSGPAKDIAKPGSVEDQNHVLPRDTDWIPKGDKSKVRANLAAIKLLKKLEAENRNPSPEEKQVLAQYTGWGGLKQVFDEGKAAYRKRDYERLWGEQKEEFDRWEKAWGKLYDEVQAQLSPEEWNKAAESILNAHYTSRTVVNGVWEGVHKLGFKGGVALTPSAGIAHFIGLQGEPSRSSTKWAAIELDDISGRILTKLYPEAKVQITGFEKARIPNNSVDLVIDNFPFAKEGPNDPRYPNFSLHNYFFVRSIDAVKPGGIVAAITSNSTMDNTASKAARQYMAERADLVGAIRLPNNAFKENAGTEVTTDILFFRKRDGSPFKGESFIRTVEGETYKGEPIELNEYFKNHPEMMLGRMSLEGTMYGGKEPALLPTAGADLASQIKAAIEKLPEGAFGAQQLPGEIAPEGVDAISSKIGGLSIREGKPAIAQPDGSFETPDWAGQSAKVAQAKSYIGIRDSTKSIIQKMLSADSTDEDIAAARGQLNKLYDDYVKRYGAVNERRSSYLDDDADFPLVLALEDANTKLIDGKDSKGKSWTRRVTEWTKSKLFSDRTIFPREAPDRVDTVDDGYQVSMNFKGKVDPDYISKLTSQPVEQVKQHLQDNGLAFENPKTGQWEPAWRYLSGRVRDKLAEARRFMADNPRYKVNVEALEKVQPEPIAFENIQFRLGSTFISPKVVERFLQEKMGLTNARVQFTQQTGNWHVDPGYAGTREAINTTTYGIHGIDADQMVDMALNLKSPVVTKLEPRVGEDGRAYSAEVKDSKKSLEAAEKQEQVKRAFKDWVKQDNQAAKTIEKQYNETANGSRVPTFDPPSWTHYPNASSDITLRDHQKKVVTRMLQDSTMLAHAVGTGKTYAMITAAMEQRRLGLAKKPMIVVQNATLEQFARSFKRLYPTAKILAPSVRQRDSKNRNRTMSMIATGDWDAVIVPQSFVNMLPDAIERQETYINDQLSEMKAAEIEARAAEGKRSPKAADLQRAVKRLQKQLDDLADRQQDNVLNFEQLGVDSLFVDEAHNYKKLQFHTKMDNIKGLDTGASQRGFSMLMKVRAVQEANQGKNVTFATGTPVSNTIAEVWNMMRYLRPDILEQHGMKDFDSFAANFGDTVTQLEMSAGGTWKPVTRFAKYSNGPELIQAWRSVADVVTPEEVQLPGLPAIRGGKVRPVVVKQTPSVTAYVAQLRAELEAFDAMSGKQKRENSHIPLVVFGRAKKATLDMRLIDSSLPDEPGSKVNAVTEEVMRIYNESEGVNGAQMIFSDLFQNPDGMFNLYDELKRKLIQRGIPEKEILVVTDDLKDAKREAAFQKFNDGEYRIAIGSTERMGTGINAQEHLIALHHMDAPARPMDIEQRNGRAWRQANQNPIIDLISYGVENTLDAALFQRLATKQRFINQILRGDVQGRNFEDAANEISMSYDEQMAAFSGDPLALEKVTLENQVRTLEALREGHFQQVRRAREELERLKTTSIPYTERRLEVSKERAEKLKAEFEDIDKVPLKFGERTFGNKKEAVKHLDDRFSALTEAAKKSIMELHKRDGADHKSITSPSGFTIGSLPIELTVMAETKSGWADEAMTKQTVLPHVRIGWIIKDHPQLGGTVTTGGGFYTSLDSVLKRIEDDPAEVMKDLESRKRQVLQLDSFVDQPFEREAELKTVSGRYQEVLGKIQKSSEVSKSRTAVAPLGMEVELSKPLEAQRQQIRNILDRIDTKIKDDDLPDNYKTGIVDALKSRLREIEEEMMSALGKETVTPAPETGGAGPSIDTGNLGELGMGGAKPSEFVHGKGTPTSNKNATVDAERAARGLPPMMAALKHGWGQAWNEAMAHIDLDPGWQDRLIVELTSKPRAITDVENVALLHRRADLRNELEKSMRDGAQAYEDGRTEAVADAEMRTLDWSNKLSELENVTKQAGTELGRGLAARKMMMNEDFSLASLELQKRAANGFRELTTEEHAQLVEIQKKLQDTEKAYDEYVAKSDARLAEAQAARKIAELKAASFPRFDKRILGYAETVVSKMEKAAEPAAARIRERLMRMGTSPDPTLIYDAAIVGSAKLARLGLNIAQFADSMVRDFGEKIRPFVPAIWDESNRLLESALAKVPSAVKHAVKTKTSAEVESDIADAIQDRMDKGERSEIAPMVQKLARLFISRGINEPEELITAVHEVLKTVDPDFTRRETMDAISGYGNFKQLSKDEISVQLRDLKGQMQQMAKLQDMMEGRPPLKTGLERRLPSVEESRLIKLVNEAKNKFQIPISDSDTQLKSSLDTLKTRLKNKTADLEDRLARGDFSKAPKRVVQMDAEANRLHYENAKVKKQWFEALMRDRLARRSIPMKILGGVGEVLNTTRVVLTSLDLSAVLRQGGFIAFAHPVRALQSFPAMFRALLSEAGQHAVNQEILSRKNYPLYQSSKLYLSEHGQKLSQMEEAYMSRWADKIPLVAASQRAYVTFLNKLRADSFDAMAKSLVRSAEITPVEAAALSNFINVATGRGSLGMKENALVGMNTIFFAPRYVASRFQLIAGQPLYGGTARTRTLVASEYGRFLIGAALVYGLASMAGAEIETDPRSADFGKLKFGNTRIDPMAGLLQGTVLITRLTTGETKDKKGKIVPIRGDKVPYGRPTSASIMGNFARTKLAPVPGKVVDILAGKNVVGEPVTLSSVVTGLTVPLALRDIYATMIEQGVPAGTAMAVLSIFGMGLQNYESDKKAESSNEPAAFELRDLLPAN